MGHASARRSESARKLKLGHQQHLHNGEATRERERIKIGVATRRVKFCAKSHTRRHSRNASEPSRKILYSALKKSCIKERIGLIIFAHR